MPNGVITGYTVEVTPDNNNSTCVSGVAVICSDCNYTNYTLQMPNTSNCTHNENVTQTRHQLQVKDPNQKVNVTRLTPYFPYHVKVTPFNEKGPGQTTTQPFKTDSEAAANLLSLRAYAALTQPGVLNVSWEPGEITGNTSYNISWAEETSIGSNQFNPHGSQTVSGYQEQTYTITGLLSYWKYRVSVRPFTEKGPSTETNYTDAVTEDSAPGQVEMFTIYQPEDSAQKLVFTVRCPPERQRNGVIISIVFRTQPEKEFVGQVNVSGNCVSNYNFNATVTAQRNYNYSASANTSRFEGASAYNSCYVAPRAPKLIPTYGFDKKLLKDPDSDKTTQTEAVLKVCGCLTDSSQGAITLAGLLVCDNSTGNCDKPPDDAAHSAATWKIFRNNKDKRIYRPTPDDWHKSSGFVSSRRKRSASLSRSIREVSNEVTYTLGSDDKCEQQNDSVYCNGPLPPETKLLIWVFACTGGGCRVADSGITIITLKAPEGPIVGAIVGGVIGALAFLVIIILIVVFVMRRRNKMEKPHKYKPSTKRHPARHPIRLRDFKAHLDFLHSDSNLRFQDEFEDIQERSPKTYSQDAATTDANKVKNRYVNILPYDHTRVKLATADDDETSDFINANYIPGFSSPREYIATQGPMTGTVDDFWRMIWEQKSRVIVMLSDLQERGRPKVDLYWPTEPNSPVQYGDVIVELKSSSTLNKYTIRDFTVSMHETQETRKVMQFFIPGWEDYSANLDSDDVLDFIHAVRQQARTSQGPITVHCSAGVGRTGTFIALDFLMQYVSDQDLDAEVDIYNLVLNMRHNRPHMVQSEKQYIFIHDTLKVIIDKKIKAMQENENIYMNTSTDDDNIYANTNPAFDPEESLYQNAETIWKPTTTL